MTKLIDQPWFCPEPFCNIQTQTNGKGMICDWNNIGTTSDIKTAFLDGLYNCRDLMDLRSEILAGKTPDNSSILNKFCGRCSSFEKSNLLSWRQFMMTPFNREYATNQEFRDKVDAVSDAYIPLQDAPIRTFKLRIFGITCNLKCLMCHETKSSKIAAEEKKYFKSTLDSNQFEVWESWNQSEKEQFFSELYHIMPTVKSIKFTSGEPLLSRGVFQFLDWCKENKFTDLNVAISTNVTVKDDDFLNVLNSFKVVNLMFSIDAVGPLDDYIRFGSDFSKKKEIIEYWESNLTNYQGSCWTTVQAMNVGYLKQLNDFCESVRLKVDFNLLHSPEWMSVHILPDEIKDKYSEQVDFLPNIKAALLLEVDERKRLQLWNQFVTYIRARDKVRRQNILSVLPEFSEYF